MECSIQLGCCLIEWNIPSTMHIAADNPADIANVFNRYFFSVFNTAQCHDSHCHLNQENYNTIDTLPDIIITPEEQGRVYTTRGPWHFLRAGRQILPSL
jgi:hypothetical protein